MTHHLRGKTTIARYNSISAALAQLVEQLLRKEKVDSSIPSSGTSKIKNLEKPSSVASQIFGSMAQLAAQFGVEKQV